jgi:hypothetical protein
MLDTSDIDPVDWVVNAIKFISYDGIVSLRLALGLECADEIILSNSPI